MKQLRLKYPQENRVGWPGHFWRLQLAKRNLFPAKVRFQSMFCLWCHKCDHKKRNWYAKSCRPIPIQTMSSGPVQYFLHCTQNKLQNNFLWISYVSSVGNSLGNRWVQNAEKSNLWHCGILAAGRLWVSFVLSGKQRTKQPRRKDKLTDHVHEYTCRSFICWCLCNVAYVFK